MKRILSLLLGIVMIFSMIPVIGITVSATTYASAEELSGLKQDADGTYLISSVEDWKIFADYTHKDAKVSYFTGSATSGTNRFGTICDGMAFKLTADLDFSEITANKHEYLIGRHFKNSTATYRFYFSGKFDGQGHTISNFVKTDLERTNGLFTAAAGAEIKNLTLKDCKFGTTNKDFYTGAIVGNVVGLPGENATTVIENVVLDNVTVTGFRVGGIVGQVNGDSVANNCNLVINNCYANITVNSDTTSLTGITVGAGAILGMASNGEANASKTTTVSITNCTVLGSVNVSSTSSNTITAGGIAGAIGAHKNGATEAVAVVSNCYADVAVSYNGDTVKTDSYTGIGGLFGTATMFATGTPVSITNCYTTSKVNASDAVSGSINKGAIIGNAAMNNTSLTVDCDYVEVDGLSAIGKGGNTLCDTTNVTVTTEVLPTLPTINGSLVLDETQVGVRYNMSNVADGVTFELNGVVTAPVSGSVTDIVSVKDLDKNSCLTVVAKVGDTEFRKPVFYGAKTYVNLTTDPEAKAVAESLITYGEYTKAYFEGAEGYEAVARVERDDVPATTPQIAKVQGIEYSGSSLVIDSAITLRHYYILEDGNISDYALSVGGESLEWKVKSEELGIYYVEFGVRAIDLATQFDVKLGNDTILRYSAINYCDRAVQQGHDDNLTNLINTLYNYRWAAYDMFNDANA